MTKQYIHHLLLQLNHITKEGIANGGSNAYSDNGRYLSVGEDIFNRGICLPSDITMTNDEQDKIIEIVKACFE